jgi:phage tail-like protein
MAVELAGTFNFRVSLNPTGGSGAVTQIDGGGGFQECSGLEIEMNVHEILEGGRNDGVVRLVGRGKYQPIVLKRGLLFPAGVEVRSDFWEWIQDTLSGERPVRRYDGVIEVLDATGNDVVATWVFDRGLPTKLTGPRLDARTGEVAIEELTIAHEGLRLKP